MNKLRAIPVFIITLVISLLFAQFGCKKDSTEDNNTPTNNPNTPPTASFTISPNTGDTQTNFLFDASGSTDNEDASSVLQVRWDWENDGVWDTDWSSDKDVNHTFSQEGNYYVSLEVKDTEGLTDAESKTVIVENTGGGGDPPVAAFTAYPTSGIAPLTVSFTDQSLNDPYSWQWNFGDGEISFDQHPTHTFASEGIYTVRLTANNYYGYDIEIKHEYIIVESSATAEPCPGTPTVYYHGQTYNTVLIGDQCWMKENLNYEIGNSWCYDDVGVNCDTYGRLYDWQTIMNGEPGSNNVPSGVQGICPNGWHIPSNEEWKILEGNVDTQYGVGSSEWDNNGWRGYDVGKRLKNTTGWNNNGNGTNISGFSALPGGRRHYEGYYEYVGLNGSFWTCTEGQLGMKWYSKLSIGTDQSYNTMNISSVGRSVRCLRD